MGGSCSVPARTPLPVSARKSTRRSGSRRRWRHWRRRRCGNRGGRAGSRTARARAPESWLAAESESGSGLKSRPATGSGAPALESGSPKETDAEARAGAPPACFAAATARASESAESQRRRLAEPASPSGLAVAVAVAVGRGDAGMGLAGGEVGMAGCRLAGGVGVGVAAASGTSAVRVARRATTTLGPHETENGRSTTAAEPGTTGCRRHRSPPSACILSGRRLRLREPKPPRRHILEHRFLSEGQRTVTRSAAFASPRPK